MTCKHECKLTKKEINHDQAGDFCFVFFFGLGFFKELESFLKIGKGKITNILSSTMNHTHCSYKQYHFQDLQHQRKILLSAF